MAIDGTWDSVTKTPLGDQKGTLFLSAAAGELSGSMSGSGGDLGVNDGRSESDAVTWSIQAKIPFAMTIVFTGTVDGDVMSGTAKAGNFGTSPFSGTRAQ